MKPLILLQSELSGETADSIAGGESADSDHAVSPLWSDPNAHVVDQIVEFSIMRAVFGADVIEHEFIYGKPVPLQ
jgi:hypothetical protein